MSQIQRLTDERWRSTPFTESYRTRSRLNEQSIAVSAAKPISVQSECPLSAKSGLVSVRPRDGKIRLTLPVAQNDDQIPRGPWRSFLRYPANDAAGGIRELYGNWCGVSI